MYKYLIHTIKLFGNYHRSCVKKLAFFQCKERLVVVVGLLCVSVLLLLHIYEHFYGSCEWSVCSFMYHPMHDDDMK